MSKRANKTILFLLHPAIVLVFAYFIVSWIMGSIHSLAFFGVLEESGEIPMSDTYMYINSRKDPAQLNTDITLVNIDSCKNRIEIARLIEQIDSLQPKVIGLDVFFRNRKGPKEDMILEDAVRKSKNIVISCILGDEYQESNDTYSSCNRNFFVVPKDSLTEGFINLDSDGGSTVQTFTPRLYLKNENSLDTLYSFAAQIVELSNESAFQKLHSRSGTPELIHYRPLRFYEINKDEIADDPELITGKTVLIGSLSEDMHKTPVNPQMHGLEIHAQIISMVLEGKYIDKLDNVWTKMLNILLCYLFTLFCWFAATRLRKGVHIFVKMAEVAIVVLTFFAGYYLFNHYQIVITYTKAIIVMGIVFLVVELYHVSIEFIEKYIHKIKIFKRNEKDNS